ncbi:uncharacterized protein LTR77_008063 [Saxophila tyrrhenica]|uniref:RWD domain-containing protein n=1 Tax=Saxophila tyrrhenica TaxID=1690608 RepID=A0AAV9P1N3_9PEZI|nr:hypothetical protein LTR77_008063 [Saxophila tyrrhenica]
MSDEVQDEVTSINAIYGDDTLVQDQNLAAHYALTFPSQPSISLHIEFPPDYPDAPPSILGTKSTGDDVAKGEGSHLVSLTRDALAEIYTPGAACVFDLIEEVTTRLQQLGLDRSARPPEEQTAQTHGQAASSSSAPTTHHHQQQSSDAPQPPDWDLAPPPPWTLSSVITEKKSIFLARCAPVTSVDQAKQYLTHLLSTDKKVAKATHNITAWRIRGEGGVQFQDCDDDGETAAGGRVLHLMELMGVWGCMVVVTRWYGGVQLGPDRFRIINSVAREAMLGAGFGQEGGKEGGKRKGKK